MLVDTKFPPPTNPDEFLKWWNAPMTQEEIEDCLRMEREILENRRARTVVPCDYFLARRRQADQKKCQPPKKRDSIRPHSGT